MICFSRLANGQERVAGDGPNGHVPFSYLEVVVAAENVASVAEKMMNGRSGPPLGRGYRRFPACGCVEQRPRGRCRLRFYGAAVDIAVVSSVVVRTPLPSVAWRLA